MARCYHRQCGRWFGGRTAFDRHIKLLKQEPWLKCLDPADIGMVWSESGWGMPAPPPSRAAGAKS